MGPRGPWSRCDRCRQQDLFIGYQDRKQSLGPGPQTCRGALSGPRSARPRRGRTPAGDDPGANQKARGGRPGARSHTDMSVRRPAARLRVVGWRRAGRPRCRCFFLIFCAACGRRDTGCGGTDGTDDRWVGAGGPRSQRGYGRAAGQRADRGRSARGPSGAPPVLAAPAPHAAPAGCVRLCHCWKGRRRLAAAAPMGSVQCDLRWLLARGQREAQATGERGA